MKRFLVAGLGNFGQAVATALANDGHEVIALDLNGDQVDRVGNLVARAVVGDATEIETLRRLGADQADAAVVSTGNNIAASVLTSMAIMDVGIREICVKVVSNEHARVMDKLGVHQTVFPEKDTAIDLARQLGGTGLLNYAKLGPDFSIQEMGVPDAWNGKTIRELDLRQQFGIIIVALHDCLSGETQASPDPDHKLNDSDTLLVAGTDEALARAAKTK